MPKRPNQCVYKEGGRRCVRNATGNSPLCRAHEVVAQAEAARVVNTGGGFMNTAADIISDVLSGRGFQRDKVAKAINEGIWEFGGGYTRYSPDLEDVDFSRTTGGAPGPQQRARPAGERWHREESPPPMPEDQRKLAAARQVLGFGPRDVITPEVLRARHRELAKKHHPDRGGSVSRMQEINAAADVIASSL